MSSQDEAKARADRIRACLSMVEEWAADMVAAWTEHDDQTLGYDSWGEYLAGEYPALPRLSREESDALMGTFRDAGMNQRAIASTVGVDQKTVSNHRGVEEISSTPRAHPPLRSGPLLQRRRAWVAHLREQGASRPQIEQAMGLTHSQVSTDLRALGIGSPDRKATKLPVDPSPVNWRTGPIPTSKAVPPKYPEAHTEPAYRRSTTLQLWASTVKACEEDNAVNRFSYDAIDADRADDREWFDQAHQTLQSAYAYLERLRVVLVDKEARDRGAHDPNERDDLRKLRVVP